MFIVVVTCFRSWQIDMLLRIIASAYDSCFAWKVCLKACQRCLDLWLNLLSMWFHHMKSWSCAFSAIMLSMCLCRASLDAACLDRVFFLSPFSACPNVFLHSSKFNLRYIAAPQWLNKLISLKYKACKLLLSLCLSLCSLCGVGISQHSSTGPC